MDICHPWRAQTFEVGHLFTLITNCRIDPRFVDDALKEMIYCGILTRNASEGYNLRPVLFPDFSLCPKLDGKPLYFKYPNNAYSYARRFEVEERLIKIVRGQATLF